jgi:hypothetical protein
VQGIGRNAGQQAGHQLLGFFGEGRGGGVIIAREEGDEHFEAPGGDDGLPIGPSRRRHPREGPHRPEISHRVAHQRLRHACAPQINQ